MAPSGYKAHHSGVGAHSVAGLDLKGPVEVCACAVAAPIAVKLPISCRVAPAAGLIMPIATVDCQESWVLSIAVAPISSLPAAPVNPVS